MTHLRAGARARNVLDMKISASAAALSGLTASGAALAVSANNVANAASTDFTPSRVDNESAEGGGVRVSISPQAAQGLPSDYATEMVAQSRAVAAYQANLKTIQASDETQATAAALVTS
jgi:flagellar hook protein FlgE